MWPGERLGVGVGVRNFFPHSLLHLTGTYGAVFLERVVRGSRAVVSSQSLVSQSLQSTETQVVTVPMNVMRLQAPSDTSGDFWVIGIAHVSDCVQRGPAIVRSCVGRGLGKASTIKNPLNNT